MSRKKVLNPNLSLSNINDISTIFPDLITGEIIINTNSEKKSLITLDDNSNFIKFIDEEQIDDKISNSLKESKEYADSKVIGLASKEWVENEISQIDLGDLSGFVTEKDIEDMATKSWIEEQNYLTEHQDISGLATKDEVVSIENVAKAYADSLAVNYEVAGAGEAAKNAAITDAEAKYQVKGDYEAAGAAAAVKTWVEEQNYLTEHQDITSLATKEDISTVNNRIDEILEIGGSGEINVINSISVNGEPLEIINKNVNIEIPDTKDYATIDYVDSKVNGKFDEAGAADAVKTWVEEQKYLTSHQDISGLATKGEVAEAVSGMATEAWVKEQNYLTEHQDISGLASKGEVAEAQAAAEAYANGLASNYDEAGAAAAVKTWVEEQNYLTEHQDISGLATKGEVDILVSGDTGKSIRYIALEEVIKVVSGAPESFDTLKEIADWILSDTTGAAKMANDIENLKVISGNPSYVNIQSDWLATATTDASYIKNKPTITGSTILGITGNTINLFSLTGDTIEEYSIDKVPSATTADKAFKDGNGNNIVDTYAIKSSVVQSDWNTTASTDASYIKNKPTLSKFTVDGVTGNTIGLVPLTGGTMKECKIDKVPSATTANSAITDGDGNNIVDTYATKSSVVQSDWNTTASTDASYINNKPRLSNFTVHGVTGNTIGIIAVSGMDDTIKECSINEVPSATTADKAFKDGDGNNIVDTYATKSSVAQSNWSETGSTMPSYIKNKPVISNYTLIGVTGNTLSFASTKENENDLNISFDKVPSANQAMSANTVFVAKNTQNKILYLTGVESVNTSSYDSIYKDEQIYTSGGCLFATSDERLKYFHGDIECDFEKLKNIPKQYFTWKDSENKGMQLGTSAQKVKELYPEIVSVDENGTHSVAYDRLSIIALAAVDKLYEENKELKERLKKIEEQLGL